jgi:hypothetical protein
MEKEMTRLKTTWAPFYIELSSCSNIIPSQFRWSKEEGIATVHIDQGIIHHKGPAKGHYGWVCESTAFIPDVKYFLITNAKMLSERFTKIYTADNDIISTNPVLFEYCPAGSNLPWTPLMDWGIHEKTKMCSMISTPKAVTPGHLIRLDYAGDNKEKLDLFGGAHGSPRIGDGLGPQKDWWRNKTEALAPYMFSVVFENTSCSHYYTEKITDCFALGTVPIYWGSPDIGKDWNMGGIILLDDLGDLSTLTRELYESKRAAIQDNLERVARLEMADDILFKKILGEETKLYTPYKTSVK